LQPLDDASVEPNDLGQITENILQRPESGLCLMGIVHGASPMLATNFPNAGGE
jgi:hypothetical protein